MTLLSHPTEAGWWWRRPKLVDAGERGAWECVHLTKPYTNSDLWVDGEGWTAQEAHDAYGHPYEWSGPISPPP